MEMLQSLSRVFAPREADEAIALVTRLRSFNRILFAFLFSLRIRLSLENFAAHNFTKWLEMTLLRKNSGQKTILLRGAEKLTWSSSLVKFALGKFLTNKLLNFFEKRAVVEVEFPAIDEPLSCDVLN